MRFLVLSEIVYICRFIPADKHGRLSWAHVNVLIPGLSSQYTTCEYCDFPLFKKNNNNNES